MEDNILPWSLDRVETVCHPCYYCTYFSCVGMRPVITDKVLPQLISQLYEPGQPNIITEAQALLANFQSSSQAWILARELLKRPDEKGKFFGALTIIVKLNRER